MTKERTTEENALLDVVSALIKHGETPKDILNHLQCYYNEEAANEVYPAEHRTSAARKAEIVEDKLYPLIIAASARKA